MTEVNKTDISGIGNKFYLALATVYQTFPNPQFISDGIHSNYHRPCVKFILVCTEITLMVSIGQSGQNGRVV